MSKHVSEELIACFIAGELDRTAAKEVHQHLSECSDCFDDYQFAARAEVGFEIRDSSIAPTADQRDLAAALAPQPATRRRHMLRTSLSAAVVLVAVVSALVLWKTRAPSVSAELVTPVAMAMQALSDQGVFVLPRGDRSLKNPEVPKRSLRSVGGASLTEPLLQLVDIFETNKDEESLFWLVTGFYVTGQIDACIDLAQLNEGSFADNLELKTIEALAYYHAGRIAEARAMLRSILEKKIDYGPARINLTAMLVSAGDRESATKLWNQSDRALLSEPMRVRLERLVGGSTTP